MRPEDLESINGELFSSLDLDEQQHVIGQYSKQDTWIYTQALNRTDFNGDYMVDWS